jgi:hypothetical protein
MNLLWGCNFTSGVSYDGNFMVDRLAVVRAGGERATGGAGRLAR